jgi:hemerythrin-like metal-binding protein
MNELSLKWEANFETGHSEIDKQHKYLFVLIKSFATSYMLKEEKEEITDMLFELEDYTKTHFANEENILAKTKGLPSSRHLAQHRQFLKFLHDLKFDFISDNKPISEELLNYLVKWLRDHILGIDKIELQQ